ncbi:MAG: DUF2336 domain-containing protein [Kiloniellales bacterium]|nr:DUF2336 domain-containing protein [Kiloniellales bacterium]
MSRLGFGPRNFRFGLACLGVAVGLSAPLGADPRPEDHPADEAASASAPSQRVGAVAARSAEADQLAEKNGGLSEADLRRSIHEVGRLGRFFARLASLDPEAARRSYWRDLQLAYAATADRLAGLLDSGGLTIADLPAGQKSARGGTGIVVDATLDGTWGTESPNGSPAAGQDDWSHNHRLTVAAFEAFAGLEGYDRWFWFDAHLKRSPTAGVMEPGSEAVAGPLLTRYWFAKDEHLRATVAARAAEGPGSRALWTVRRDELAIQAGRAVERTKAELGAAWHAALAANWQQQLATSEAVAESLAGAEVLADLIPEARTQVVEDSRDPAGTEEIAVLRGRLADLEGRIGKLDAQLRQSRDEASRLETELAAARDRAGARENRDDRLTRAYAELEAAQRADQRRLAELETERAAERRRIAELEQSLSAMLAQLDDSRSEIDRYQSQIQENQQELSRYRDEMRATGEELSRYREELDAAQDLQPESAVSLVQSLGSRQTAVIGLAVVLLLLSMMTIALLLRRTTADGVAARAPLAQGRDGEGPRDGRRAAPSRRTSPERSESEALAAQKDPPRDRLLALAGDRIEVALPILVHSAALTDADLIAIVHGATTQHRMAIAMRRGLGERVVDALVEAAEVKVAAAVLQNAAAEITSETYGKLARQAEIQPALKAALLERPGLPAAIRARLSGPEEPAAPSEAPRPDLAAKLQAAAAELDAAAAEQEAAERNRKAAAATTTARAQAGPEAAEIAQPEEPPGGAARDTAASGEVPPHALIEALRQGKMELFEALFGKMTGLRPPRLQQVVYGGGGENLAVACRALGLGKPIMTSIFIWSRKGREDLGAVNPRELSNAMTAFDATSPETARETVAAWIAGDAIPGEWDPRLHGPAAE